MSESCSVVSDSLQPHGLDSPWNSPGQNIGVGSLSILQGLLNPGIKPRSPSLQADSLPAKPLGKPKNTGVGSLSILQWIFPTQELNWGVLHCRQILYQLSYQESPIRSRVLVKSVVSPVIQPGWSIHWWKWSTVASYYHCIAVHFPLRSIHFI